MTIIDTNNTNKCFKFQDSISANEPLIPFNCINVSIEKNIYNDSSTDYILPEYTEHIYLEDSLYHLNNWENSTFFNGYEVGEWIDSYYTFYTKTFSNGQYEKHFIDAKLYDNCLIIKFTKEHKINSMNGYRYLRNYYINIYPLQIDTRIETNCCLLVCCEPNKYKMIGE